MIGPGSSSRLYTSRMLRDVGVRGPTGSVHRRLALTYQDFFRKTKHKAVGKFLIGQILNQAGKFLANFLSISSIASPRSAVVWVGCNPGPKNLQSETRNHAAGSRLLRKVCRVAWVGVVRASS